MMDIVLWRSSIQGSDVDMSEPVSASSNRLDFPITEHNNDVVVAEAWAARADLANSDENRDRDI
jgi:hypothetical protein